MLCLWENLQMFKCSSQSSHCFLQTKRPEMRDERVVFWHQMETLRSFVWPLTLQNLNEIQNQIQCFAGNNIKNYSSTLASIEMLFLRILELKWFCLLQFLPHIRLKRVSGYSLPGRRKYCFKIFFHENMP